MARGRGGRGRGGRGRGGKGRGRSRSRSRSRSKSKSRKRSTRRRSTAASKRRSVRSKAKARRAANRSATSKKKSTKKKSRKPMGRSRHTRGGQHAANKNQNKKARRTVRSVRKAVNRKLGKVGNTIGAGFGLAKAAAGRAIRGAAANAATHIANSQYNRQLKQANWTKRDMSKLTPQQRRKFDRLSRITGRDYSTRIPGMRINLSADRLAQFGGFADSGWYRGLTKAIPGIKSLRINKQLYSNPYKKGWHSSQRMGKGHGVKPRPIPRSLVGDTQIPESFGKPIRSIGRQIDMGPKQDWLGDFYRTYNIGGRGGRLDQRARDYWSKAAETRGIDAVKDIIRGTAQAEGTWGGRSEPRRKILTTKRRAKPHYRGRGKSKRGSVAKAVANKSLNII